MTILVLSDSHGCISNMIQAVEQTNPDMILHLGDCWNDVPKLRERYPHIPLHQVPGNCDFRPDEQTERILTLQGFRILLCHGHTYGVKHSMMSAGYAAMEKEADLFIQSAGKTTSMAPTWSFGI